MVLRFWLFTIPKGVMAVKRYEIMCDCVCFGGGQWEVAVK